MFRGFLQLSSETFFNVRRIELVLQAEAQLQPATRAPPKTSRTKSPTHNEMRTRDRCGNSTTQSQAPDDGYINVRNMLST